MASAYPQRPRPVHVEPLLLPLDIDDAILTAPVLYGELFPLVSTPPAKPVSPEEVERLIFGPNSAFNNAIVPRPKYTPPKPGVAIDFDTDDDSQIRKAVLAAFQNRVEAAQNSESGESA